MLAPKPLAREAVAAALEKALRYRLLNEPSEAESICHDVLAVQPQDQTALVTLLLALTDQFERRMADALEAAKAVLPRLSGQYSQIYYEGIIHERWAKTQLARGVPFEAASHWLREAMRCYARAEELAVKDDPDATLRWNTCARLLIRHAQGAAVSADSLTHDVQAGYGDDVPRR